MTTQARHVRTLTMILVGGSALSDAPTSLRNAADRAGVLMGTAVRPAQLSEITYATSLSRDFNMVEPEDAMKWWVVRRNQDRFDFGPGDEVVRFAHAHGMKVRGHCLLWARDNPEGLAPCHFTPAQLSRLLHEPIAHVSQRSDG